MGSDPAVIKLFCGNEVEMNSNRLDILWPSDGCGKFLGAAWLWLRTSRVFVLFSD
jgi:hypothetical protein